MAVPRHLKHHYTPSAGTCPKCGATLYIPTAEAQGCKSITMVRCFADDCDFKLDAPPKPPRTKRKEAHP